MRFHEDHIGRLLRTLGWTPQKPQRRARQRDEALIEPWPRRDWPRMEKAPASGGPGSPSPARPTPASPRTSCAVSSAAPNCAGESESQAHSPRSWRSRQSVCKLASGGVFQ
ncbi:MAG: winged helix-turn-helix domain-containing protein [Candidatus Sumerlaeia bacterium]|nr:winged helix-turn-helix domain-containing protein [Candidatus Sumerlaeia bacterium]